MVLNRIGNKKAIAQEIIKHFPRHECYVEPFFGAGGMWFSKPKAKYNIVNDIDSDVYNIFNVLRERPAELERAFEMMPVHQDLFKGNARASKTAAPRF